MSHILNRKTSMEKTVDTTEYFITYEQSCLKRVDYLLVLGNGIRTEDQVWFSINWFNFSALQVKMNTNANSENQDER